MTGWFASMFSFLSCGTNTLTSSTFSKAVSFVIFPERKPEAIGENGTTPILCSKQYGKVFVSQSLSNMLYRFCTADTGVTSCARLIVDSSTCDKPHPRIKPSSMSFPIASATFSTGTSGLILCR